MSDPSSILTALKKFSFQKILVRYPEGVTASPQKKKNESPSQHQSCVSRYLLLSSSLHLINLHHTVFLRDQNPHLLFLRYELFPLNGNLMPTSHRVCCTTLYTGGARGGGRLRPIDGKHRGFRVRFYVLFTTNNVVNTE